MQITIEFLKQRQQKLENEFDNLSGVKLNKVDDDKRYIERIKVAIRLDEIKYLISLAESD